VGFDDLCFGQTVEIISGTEASAQMGMVVGNRTGESHWAGVIPYDREAGRMNGETIAIEIRELTKQYGSFKAVDSLNLDVAKGRIFGFLGPNGAGKTTTLKMIAGLTRPDQGLIRLSGMPVQFGSMHGREHIGYLPDVPECYGYMKPLEYLLFCGNLHGNDTLVNRSTALELLERVGLSGIDKRIASFSRGMKQRLGIAQALINHPDIILMDEPASALDPTGRYEVMEIIRKLKGTVTVFFSSHIIADIERVCDEIAIIDRGIILENGSIERLRHQYDRKSITVDFPRSVSPEKIADLTADVAKESWCTKAELSGENRIRIYFLEKLKAQTELIGLLASKQIPVEMLNSNEISLEDIFLEVVHK
jgi:ABC-2 type transport system ATP-binding protein